MCVGGVDFHRTVLVFCSPIVACVAHPYGLGDSPNDLVQFQVVGWVCRWVDELPRVSSDKIKHFRQGTICGVALFLIARGVLVHEFVVSAHPAGLQRSYEHPMVCMIHGRPCTPYMQGASCCLEHTHTLSLSLRPC